MLMRIRFGRSFRWQLNQLKDHHEAELKKVEAEFDHVKKELQAEKERLAS